MTHPAPRPALRKAHDAHIHPAAPGRPGLRLAPAERRPAAAPTVEAIPGPRRGEAGGSAKPAKAGKTGKSSGPGKGDKAGKAKPVKGKSGKGKKQSGAAPSASTAPKAVAGPASRSSRLSGPLAGHTSDSLRGLAKRQRARKGKQPKEKLVELTVRVPKALRKDLRAAAKSSRRSQDQIVTALLRGWLGD